MVCLVLPFAISLFLCFGVSVFRCLVMSALDGAIFGCVIRDMRALLSDTRNFPTQFSAIDWS